MSHHQGKTKATGAIWAVLISAMAIIVICVSGLTDEQMKEFYHQAAVPCRLLYVQPMQHELQVETIVSSDNRTLVRYQGFIEITPRDGQHGGHTMYMPLELYKVDSARGDSSTGSTLTLYFNCGVVLEFELKEKSDQVWALVSKQHRGIIMVLNNDVGQVQFKMELEMRPHERYFCSRHWSLPGCAHSVKTEQAWHEVRLRTSEMIIEYEGDPAILGLRQFSRPAVSCSTMGDPVWNSDYPSISISHPDTGPHSDEL